MRALIPTLGSRGDIQPYINLGVELVKAGLDVTIATHPYWRETIESFQIDFFPLGPDVDLDVEAARARANFNIFAVLKLLNGIHQVASSQLLAILHRFDLLIVSHTLFGALEAKKLNRRYVSVTLVPSVIPEMSSGKKSAGKVLQAFMYSFYFHAGPWAKIRKSYGLESVTRFDQLLSSELNLVPISSHIYPRNPYWASNHIVTGIWQLPSRGQSLPDTLSVFLEEHKNPIIVALGAMSFDTTSDVHRLRLIIRAITASGSSGIIQGFSNSIKEIDVPENIFHIGPFPHDVLFRHGKLIIHHGGFGTMTTALSCGKPSITIPHILDQPFWANRLHELKLSPKPIPAKHVTENTLISAIDACINDAAISENTTGMMERLRQENGLAKATSLIEAFAREGAC